MKKIAIVSYGGLPLPPVKGGAVENLIQFFVENNELNKMAELTVFSSYDDKAFHESRKFKNTEFVYIRKRKLAETIFGFTNRVFRKLRFGAIFQVHPYLIAIVNKIKRMDYDCIVVENRPEFIPYLRKKVGNPIILHMHNDYFNSKYFLASKILNSSTKVLAVSDYVKRCIETIDEHADKVDVLRNVIDTERFMSVTLEERNNLRARYSIASSDVVFAFFGRTIPGKGVRELIQAFIKLSEKHSNVKLLIVGAAWFGESADSSFVRELKQLSLNLVDKIIFMGYIDYSCIAEQYACADVVVVPSIIGEATPLTVLEAMAAGKALIVSDSGGIPEHVDSECAIEIARGEGFVEGLFHAMDMLASNADLREGMGKQGRERAFVYDKKNYLSKLLELIDN